MREQTLKPGDRVRVADDMECASIVDILEGKSERCKYAGKEVTIRKDAPLAVADGRVWVYTEECGDCTLPVEGVSLGKTDSTN